MGQYYKYLIIDKNNTPHTASSWAYNNGAKLMEHSYIGNNFVNSAFNLIYCNPCRVAWVGDYSNNGDCVYNDKAHDFNKYYDMCWGKYDEETEIELPPLNEDETLNEDDMIKFNVDDCNYFLINHTKKIYIDIKKYVDENKWHEERDWHNYETDEDEHYSYDMCINPLPLLTACGNGQGGGDYRSDIGSSDIGYWTLDLLELADDKPFGYDEVEYYFKE